MLLPVKEEIMTRTELEDLSAQLSYIVKSLRFVKKICRSTSPGNSDPIQRLEVCELILKNKIDDLNSIVRKLNKKATNYLSNSNKAA